MSRIFHPWNKWEDYKCNFYGGFTNKYDKKESEKLCVELLGDAVKFDLVLKRLFNEWVYSLEHNLTNQSLNKIAYLGQAACAYEYNIPSDISMGAYNLLSEKQKIEADAVAKKFIMEYNKKYEYIEKTT